MRVQQQTSQHFRKNISLNFALSKIRAFHFYYLAAKSEVCASCDFGREGRCEREGRGLNEITGSCKGPYVLTFGELGSSPHSRERAPCVYWLMGNKMLWSFFLDVAGSNILSRLKITVCCKWLLGHRRSLSCLYSPVVSLLKRLNFSGWRLAIFSS